MENKMMGLHKSNTFSSFGNNKLGNWFANLGHRKSRKVTTSVDVWIDEVIPKDSKSLSSIVECPKFGSDGESEEASGASDEITPVPIQSIHRIGYKKRKRTENEISKRLSLPADVHLPEQFLHRQLASPTLDGPISRTLRRQSLSEIGFGKMESYTRLGMLGMGTYAMVYKGRSKLTQKNVALKVINLEHDEGAPCTAIREVSLLKDLKHNNIVTLHDIIYTKSVLTLVFEYMETDLKTYIDKRSLCVDPHIKIFLFQLLRGLDYCHKRKVLHRDLKPQNILINEKKELKLADFGLARAKSVPIKTYSFEVVTLWYRPPDVLLGSTDYTTSIDMWGVGCIFYEMSTCKPLFTGSDIEEQLRTIFRIRGMPTEAELSEFSETFSKYQPLDKETFENSVADLSNKLGIVLTATYIYSNPNQKSWEELSNSLTIGKHGVDLINSLLQYNPDNRISAEKAMESSYFNSLGPEIHNIPGTESIIPYVMNSLHPELELTRNRLKNLSLERPNSTVEEKSLT